MPSVRFYAFYRLVLIAFLLLGAWALSASLAVTPAGAQQDGATAATDAAPIVVPIRDLNLFRDFGSLPEQNVSAVALSPNERRLYVGIGSSGRADRRNLVVFTLDAVGKVASEPRRYQVSGDPLVPGFNATVGAILVDAAHDKLYLASARGGATPDPATRMLTVYDLAANGEPTGTPRHYETGHPFKGIMAIARHPRLNLLYMVGWGGPGVYVYQLDAKGEPQGRPKEFAIGGYGKFEVAVSADGKRLYLGTHPNTVEIVDLDEIGMPSGPARSFAAGMEEGKVEYLRFQYSPRALYLRRETADGACLAVWPLDEKGDPIGAPQIQGDLAVSALAVDAKGNRLWAAADATFKEAFSGKTMLRGVVPMAMAVGANGVPALPRKSYSIARRAFPFPLQTGAVLGVSPSGRAVLLTKSLALADDALGNRVKDYRARVTILEIRHRNNQKPATVPALLQMGLSGAQAKVGDLAVDAPSSWINLDALLKDQRGPLVMHLVVSRANVDFTPSLAADAVEYLKVRVEIAEGDPGAGGRVLKTLTETVQGEHAAFVLPGYAFEPAQERVAVMATMSDHAKRYLAAARQVALKPGERPRLYPISCFHLMGGQGNLEQLKMSAETVSSLGFNVANVYWWGAIPPKQIDSILDSYGIDRRMVATYNPPSYFDFDQDKMNPQALDAWAKSSLAAVATSGGTINDVAWQLLSDEPGWYYPTILNEVRESPLRLEAFRNYLRQKGFKPADLGAADWNGIFPIGASKATDLPSRRLYYWTMRFFPESASRGHKLAREALERVAGRKLLTPVNWNAIQWHIPSPNVQIANNRIVDPDTAYGMFDWLESGRISAHTLWTEDWMPDQQAQTESLFADMLRSSSMLGDQKWGSYVIGPVTGAHPAGASYRILSLIGHGASAVDFYTWGSELLTPAGAWSENLKLYPQVADALSLVGRGERLLHVGRPARGTVALFFPGASALWDGAGQRHYYQEIYPLHYALIHAGYSVDFVDEKDLAAGELGKRGYATLYLTAPNVPVKAQEQVGEWVKGGGTLVATPGAAAADEYNSPVTTLDDVLGLKSRTPVRDAVANENDWESLPHTGKLAVTDARFGKGEMALFGPIKPLETNGAKKLAEFSSGGAAITANQYGKGRAISYGFFPGWQYWLSPDRYNLSRLPLHWGAAQRDLIVAAPRIANTPRAVVVSKEGVEACRLQSDKGIALVLLNWTDEPVSNLTITLPDNLKFSKVTSLQSGAVKSVKQGNSLKMTLPLKYVDVLMIE